MVSLVSHVWMSVGVVSVLPFDPASTAKAFPEPLHPAMAINKIYTDISSMIGWSEAFTPLA
jgi:hypothetical protein